MTRSERSLRTPRALSLMLSSSGAYSALFAAFILAIVLAVVRKSWLWLFGVPVVVPVFIWYERNRAQKMSAFFMRAVETYAKEESPIALHYILIGYATAQDSDRQKVLSFLNSLLDLADRATNQRIRKVLDVIGSREWTLRDSSELKSALCLECFEAWVRFDLSVFERLEGLPSSIPPRYITPRGQHHSQGPHSPQ